VVLADNFVELIAGRRQKIRVRRLNVPQRIELDHRLGTIDCLDLALEERVLRNLCGHISRKFHHPDQLACGVVDRVVGRVNPDFSAVLGEATEHIRLALTLRERRPERTVFW